MAGTFYPFARLPTELRLRIWALAATPRLVDISARPTEVVRWKRIAPDDFSSPTPPPAMMHVCRESRRCAPYQKAFYTLVPGEPEHRYIWSKIRRLRLTIPPGSPGDLLLEVFSSMSRELMAPFTALRELHLAISEYFCAWGATWACSGFGPCARENVRFLDLSTGLLLTGPQLEMASAWEWQQGGRVMDMDDFDYELRFMLDNYTGLDLPELAKIE
ncbi:hypothetical protein HDV57DRAFT_518135 [Trichoderma longibrachiatum]|uniref:2EXR domain-containing protein n=1 Tax=Trichoderma longibrachiatum ATCC 18648 TaxID=983965 RepID=A0A2T4C957_TRILO|nr:hypothetical protein M440DRAFT_1420232 [Trichoderma longibrachiatum ATCC 18648]